MENIKVAVMRSSVDGVDRIILQGVSIFGKSWVQAKDSIIHNTASRLNNPNITWMGWFDEVDRPLEVVNVKI